MCTDLQIFINYINLEIDIFQPCKQLQEHFKCPATKLQNYKIVYYTYNTMRTLDIDY